MADIHDIFRDQRRNFEDVKRTAFDGGGGGGYDHPMEERVKKLEADLTTIKVDLAVIKANGATKSDVAEAKVAISEAKSAIIMWVVMAIFLAQLLPMLKDFLKPSSGGAVPAATAPVPAAAQRQAPTPAK